MLGYVIGGLAAWAATRKPTKRARARIGQARSRAQIMADPLASVDEVASLAKDNPLDALNHPNCPADLWWQLAARYPVEALQSPAGTLFLLEDPTKWQTMEEIHIGNWIARYVATLREGAQRLFATDCAERALPVFAKKFANDHRLEHAIQVARAYALEEAGKKNLAEALAAAKESETIAIQKYASRKLEGNFFFRSGRTTTTYDHAYHPAVMAASAVSQTVYPEVSARASASDAAIAIAEDAEDKVTDVTSYAVVRNQTYKQERAWQWRRLLEYLAIQDRRLLRQMNYQKIMRQVVANAAREAYYGPEVDRRNAQEAAIQKAIEQARAGAAQVAQVMSTPEASSLPSWFGWGLVGIGATTAAIVVGPEILAAAGIVDGMSLLEVLAAAGDSATEITAVAQESGVTTVSLAQLADALESDQALAELSGGSAFLEGLLAKLEANGLTVDLEDVVAATMRGGAP